MLTTARPANTDIHTDTDTDTDADADTDTITDTDTYTNTDTDTDTNWCWLVHLRASDITFGPDTPARSEVTQAVLVGRASHSAACKKNIDIVIETSWNFAYFCT